MQIRDPLLLPAIGFTAGILADRASPFPSRDLLWGAAVFAMAFALSRFRKWYALPLFLFLGAWTDHHHAPAPPPSIDATPSELLILEGCVVEPPVFSEGREQFVLELEPGARVRAHMYLKEGEPAPTLRYGQRVELEARVRQPHNFGNPGAFDYVAYLARRSIHWNATVRSGTTPRVLDGECGSAWLSHIYRLRSAILDRIERLYAGDAYAIGMLQALLVGESGRLERTWSENYRRTGTYHAIVVSGLHVTVIGGALIGLLRLAAIHRTVARLSAVGIIWIYAGICGWEAPVMRAASGFTLFAIGRFYFREVRVLNLLSAVALVLLAIDPAQIFEASFQLTFLAMAALGALASTEEGVSALRRGVAGLNETQRDLHLPANVAQFRVELRLIAETLHFGLRLPMAAAYRVVAVVAGVGLRAAEGLLVSGSAQLGLALPMILFFHRLSLSGLTANLAATPLLTMAVPAGFVAVATGWSWPAALTRSLLSAAQAVVDWHAAWEPDWPIPAPPLWLAALFIGSLLVLALRRKPLWLAPAMASLALIVVHPFAPDRAPGSLELTAIDVGQGESLLVGFPDGKWMLVDGGGFPVFGRQPVRVSRLDLGEDVVAPYLLSRSIRRLDVVVNTHQHDDHAAGLPAIMRSFRPRELWAGATPPSEVWDRLTATANRYRIAVKTFRRGQSFDFGGAHIDVLAPSEDYAPRAVPTNNDSLALRIRHGAHTFLLTGDMERQSELAAAAGLGKADVLKVAHHGSRTSTGDAFLEAAAPAVALISAGKDNLFRHPHPDVTRRLGDRNVMTLRTDEWGLVTVRSDGRRLTVESERWKSRRQWLESAAGY